MYCIFFGTEKSRAHIVLIFLIAQNSERAGNTGDNDEISTRTVSWLVKSLSPNVCLCVCLRLQSMANYVGPPSLSPSQSPGLEAIFSFCNLVHLEIPLFSWGLCNHALRQGADNELGKKVLYNCDFLSLEENGNFRSLVQA